MLKKVVLAFVVAMVAGGLVWGHNGSCNDDNAPNDYLWPGAGHLGRVDLRATPPTLSIEARNSARMFRSDVDNFIDPRFHDLDMGTFFFAGANIPGNARHVNFGFARSFDNLYLALYYGGRLVDGYGHRHREDSTAFLPDERERTAHWRNDLALLLGFERIGLRLDVTMNSNTSRSASEGSSGEGIIIGDLERCRMNFGPSFALTLGASAAAQEERLAPWIRIGYRFPDLELSEIKISTPAGTFSKYSSLRTGAALELSSGASLSTGDYSLIGGEIRFGNTFADRLDRSQSSPGSVLLNYDVTDRRGGMISFGLGVFYSHVIDFGFDAVAIGFSPNLNFGLTSRSNSWDGDTGSFLDFGDRWTTLDMSIDFGVNWQVSQRIVFFAGAELRVFDWTTWSETGEHYVSGAANLEARRSGWVFSGFNITGPAIGITFTPVEEVVVGLGMNSFINGLFGNEQSVPTFDFTVSARLDGWW